jgi:solute carrier family 25 iron transporter 28/37
MLGRHETPLPCTAEHAPAMREVLLTSSHGASDNVDDDDDDDHHGGHGHSHGFGGDSYQEMLAGGVAGLSEHFATFPFDTIKTRMQQSGGTKRSFWATFGHLVRNEPLRNLYRGCGPVLACSFPAHAAYFALYEHAKRLVGNESRSTYIIASCAATIGHDSVSVPFDVVKQHMQIDGHRHHNSSLACLRCIVRDHGVKALVKSIPTTVAMNMPHISTHWVVYEEMKQLLRLGNEEHFEPRYIVAGFVAGATAACVSTPLDVVKTQLQLMKSPNFVTACRDVYSRGGMMGFTTGMVPRMCAIAPSAAVVMSAYEGMKKLLKVSS